MITEENRKDEQENKEEKDSRFLWEEYVTIEKGTAEAFKRVKRVLLDNFWQSKIEGDFQLLSFKSTLLQYNIPETVIHSAL